MTTELKSIELIYTGRRGRPRLNLTEDEKLKRRCEKQKQYNLSHPEKYKEVYMKTVEKHRAEINERQRERQRLIRTQKNVLKSTEIEK